FTGGYVAFHGDADTCMAVNRLPARARRDFGQVEETVEVVAPFRRANELDQEITPGIAVAQEGGGRPALDAVMMIPVFCNGRPTEHPGLPVLDQGVLEATVAKDFLDANRIEGAPVLAASKNALSWKRCFTGHIGAKGADRFPGRAMLHAHDRQEIR